MNWEEHKQNYKMLAAANGMTIAEYAAQHGLNPNTARRYLRSSDAQPAGKKVSVKLGGDQRIDHGGDQSAKKAGGTGRRQGKTQKKKADARDKVSKLAAPTRRGGKAVAQPTLQLIGEVISKVRDQVPQYDSSGALENAGLVDRSMFQLPSPEDFTDARDLLEKAGVDKLEMIMLEKTMAHMLLIERGRQQVIDLYAEMQEDSRDKDDDDGSPPPVLKLMGVFLSASGAIADLSRTMANLRQSYQKELREQEKHDLKVGEPAIIKRAYKLRKEKGLTALETAEYIEMHGGKVPPLLLELVRAELKEPPKKDDSEGAVSAEVLEERSRIRQAEAAAQHERTIAAKKLEVAHIVDELGVGDFDENGALNDGALAAPFAEGEEPDDALNAELYGNEFDGAQQHDQAQDDHDG